MNSVKKMTCAFLILAGGAMVTGCAHSDTPPGPGPTAVPDAAQRDGIGPNAPVNTESHMGGGGMGSGRSSSGSGMGGTGTGGPSNGGTGSGTTGNTGDAGR